MVWMLVTWAAGLSLESLFRVGGYATDHGLPPKLEREGSVYLRGPLNRPDQPPPEGVVVLEAADYFKVGDPSPARSVRLRRVSLLASTQSLKLPVDLIGPKLLGPTAEGRCVVLGSGGTILTELSTPYAWQAWRDSQRQGPAQTLAWLAGFRPRRANSCLWESLPR